MNWVVPTLVKVRAYLISWSLAGLKQFISSRDSDKGFGCLAGSFYVVLADSSNEACKLYRLLTISKHGHDFRPRYFRCQKREYTYKGLLWYARMARKERRQPTRKLSRKLFTEHACVIIYSLNCFWSIFIEQLPNELKMCLDVVTPSKYSFTTWLTASPVATWLIGT